MVEQLVTVGDRIKRAVENSGQPYMDVIKQIPISKSAYSQWINNVTSPSVSNLLKLAEITKCDPAWILFGYERGQPEVREVVREVIKEVRVPDSIGDTMVQIPEITYCREPDDFLQKPVRTNNHWVLPRALVELHFRCEAEWSALVEVTESGVGGLTEYDYVLIDRTPGNPSRAGLYVLATEQISLAVRHLTRMNSEDMVRVRGAEEDYEINLDHVNIIGRVMGVIKRQMAGPYQPSRMYDA